MSEDKDTIGVFGFLHEVGFVPSLGSRYSKKQLLRVAVKHLPEKSHPLAEFFQRPWFFRRWVVQEAWLARPATSTFYCERHSITVVTMAKAARRQQFSGIFDYATNMVAELGRPMERVNMLELLYKFYAAGFPYYCRLKGSSCGHVGVLLAHRNSDPIFLHQGFS